MMLSCDAGTACSLVLLQVSTATAGTKSQGHPTRATPTTPNSSHSTETMATSGQPTRAGRSQAAVEVGVVSTKEVGRDRKRPDNDGNFNVNRTSRVTGASPVGAGGGGTALAEQNVSGSTTPTPGQAQAQRGKAQQEKPFSYAQALKTKSSPFSKPSSAEGGGVYRAPSSKMSSRSQTPSESSLLGGKEGVMMKGAPPHPGANHTSVEDSLDFELRSSSALSITTASESVTSERSASRQSLPLDASSQRGEEECGVKPPPAFDTRTERSDYDDSEGITFMGPQLDYEQAERSPIAPPPMMTSDPSLPTNQFRVPSPAARSASPINSTTVTVNHPSANQCPGQRSAPPTQQSIQQSPSIQNQEDKATFSERRAPPHSPAALSPVPPGLSPNKEHQYKSPGASPQHPSMAGETDASSIGAQVEAFKVLQQLEQTPSSSGLVDNETDGSNKSMQPPTDSDAAILLPSSNKPPPPAPSSSDGSKDPLMLPLPMDRSPLAQQQQQQQQDGGGGGPGVLPNPSPSLAAPPHMTSILPHPPTNSQMGFAGTPPQQAHLPLRPPGQLDKVSVCDTIICYMYRRLGYFCQ